MNDIKSIEKTKEGLWVITFETSNTFGKTEYTTPPLELVELSGGMFGQRITQDEDRRHHVTDGKFEYCMNFVGHGNGTIRVVND